MKPFILAYAKISSVVLVVSPLLRREPFFFSSRAKHRKGLSSVVAVGVFLFFGAELSGSKAAFLGSWADLYPSPPPPPIRSAISSSATNFAFPFCKAISPQTARSSHFSMLDGFFLFFNAANCHGI